MLIRKKIFHLVLVLGWLGWSLPVFASGEHEGGHPGKHGDAKDAGKHGGYSGKHAGKGKKGGHHGYSRRKGPPADIPSHIRERLDPDGS